MNNIIILRVLSKPSYMYYYIIAEVLIFVNF